MCGCFGGRRSGVGIRASDGSAHRKLCLDGRSLNPEAHIGVTLNVTLQHIVTLAYREMNVNVARKYRVAIFHITQTQFKRNSQPRFTRTNSKKRCGIVLRHLLSQPLSDSDSPGRRPSYF